MRRLLAHPVAKNAVALYGLQFAGYVFPLVTLPYLARVLRPQGLGVLMFAQSFALWASLAVEYGFNLSATREIARSRNNAEQLSRIAAGVLGAKVLLIAGVLVISAAALFAVPLFRGQPVYLLWAVPQTLAFGLSPLWFFQGTERIVRSVAVEFSCRTIATAFIFLLVRLPEDGWIVLALQAAAGSVTNTLLMCWMYREIGFRWPDWSASRLALKQGWDMFLFRGAYNIYTTANAFILGLFVAPVQVGYYGGAEKIAKALQGLGLPMTQALYPRMSHLVPQSARKAARLAMWTLSFSGTIGFAMAIAVALLAPTLVRIILGPGYETSTSVLYVFALFLPMNAINNALIMHWMLPHGMDTVVSKTTVTAIVTNIVAAFVLAPRYAHVGMAWAMLVAETVMFVTLAVALLRRSLTPIDVLRSVPPPPPELL